MSVKALSYRKLREAFDLECAARVALQQERDELAGKLNLAQTHLGNRESEVKELRGRINALADNELMRAEERRAQRAAQDKIIEQAEMIAHLNREIGRLQGYIERVRDLDPPSAKPPRLSAEHHGGPFVVGPHDTLAR